LLAFYMVFNSGYSIVIRSITPFTAFTSLTSLVAMFDSAAFLVADVTTPLFVVTEVLKAPRAQPEILGA